MKVCVFGDSIAKGVVFDNEKNRYSLLKNSFINMIEESGSIAINNVSCFGCTVTKGMTLLGKVESELKDYDYTCIEFGGNDCDFNWAAIAENPDIKHESNTPLEIFKEVYINMVEQIKEAGSKPVLVTLPPIESVRFFNWVSKGLNAENILKYLGDVNYISRWQSMYNDAVKNISEHMRLPLLDIRSIFAEKNINDYLCIDGIHPNEEGHKLIYTAIAQSIKLIPVRV